MATVDFKSIDSIHVTDSTVILAEGFMCASFSNLGVVDATLTQGGKSWTLNVGAVFNLPVLSGNNGWNAVTIDATGTDVECVYI